MSVFKSAMRAEYENWMSNTQALYTARGNRKSPSHSEIIRFISNSLKKIQSDTIIKSFRVCGISPSEKIPINEYNHCLRSIHESSDEIVDYQLDSDTEIECEHLYES